MAPEIPHDQPSIESPLSGERLDVLASEVAASIESDQRTRHLTTEYLPSRREVIGVLEHKTIDLDLTQIGGSALTDNSIDVPESPTVGIPVTYVPARNTIFLSYSLAWAEVLEINNIFIGVNAVDYSGYPDCRPEFISAFEELANLATQAGVEGRKFRLFTPLQHLSKVSILLKAHELGVPVDQTISCYDPSADGTACGLCDSCRLRWQAEKEVGNGV